VVSRENLFSWGIILSFILLTSNPAFCAPYKGVGGNGAISTSDFAAKTIFQRVAGGTTKNVVFQGSYVGKAPTSVEVELVNSTGLTVAQAWTALASATISGGSFSGTLTVPQGGWYFWQARGKDNSGNVLYTSPVTSNKFGVGILVSCLGQSNMWNSFIFTSGSPPTPSDLTTKYQGSNNPGGGFANYIIPPVLTTITGDGAITLANKLQAGFNLPIGLVFYAIPNTGLEANLGGSLGYWLNLAANTPYPNYILGLGDIGGDTEILLWTQGENDAQGGVSGSSYESDLTTIYSRFQASIGRTTSTMKFYGTQTGTCTVCGSGNSWADIRAAQEDWFGKTTGAVFTASAIDIPVSDNGIHYSVAGMVRMALRDVQTILYNYGLAAYPSKGPSIASASRVAGSAVVKVAVTPGAGTRLQDSSGNTAGTGLGGWVVSVNGSPVSISSTAIVEPAEVDLTLASVPANGSTVTLNYLAGINPINNDTQNIVYDNTSPQGDTLGLPLLPTVGAALDGVIPVSQI
jgi:hypothetical protein